MTDEIYLKKVRQRLNTYITYCNIHGLPINRKRLDQEAKRAIICVQNAFYQKTGIHTPDHSHKGRRELEARLGPMIDAIIEEAEFDGRKNKAKLAVNRIAVESILEPLLEDAGYEYYLDFLSSSVKLNIKISRDRKALLYASYAKIRKSPEDIINNILKLKQIHEFFGPNSGIIRIEKDESGSFKKIL